MLLTGTRDFIDALQSKYFLNSKKLITIMNGEDMNGHYFYTNGFDKPVLVLERRGLRLKVPEKNFSLNDVVKYSGADIPIEVINVENQENRVMFLGDFIRHFLSAERLSILNVLSFEFSNTRLSDLVEPPHVVSELSLIEKVCPDSDDNDYFGEINSTKRLHVEKYCLMSMAGSYTDFHIDFGGSAVWYHILWGEKIFYLIPPTKPNLEKYFKWLNLDNNRNIFFPDTLEKTSLIRSKSEKDALIEISPVYRLRVLAGQTILLPAGWIHAVYTYSDSLVFGGNFLTPIHVPIQLEIYKNERESKTEERFMFPYFEKIHWFFADFLLCKFKQACEQKTLVPTYELEAAHALLVHLSLWHTKHKNRGEDREFFIPGRKYLDANSSKILLDGLTELYPLLASRSSSSSIRRVKMMTMISYKTRNVHKNSGKFNENKLSR